MKLQISHAKKSFGEDDVLVDASLQIKNHEKVALIGKNGSGKTTLLKIIAGEENLDDGYRATESNVRIGTLSQISFENEKGTVYETLLEVFKPVIEIGKKLEEAALRLGENPDEKDLKEYDRLQNEYERLGGYEYETELKSVFFNFGFSIEDLARPIQDFSSGQKTRIALVKLLLSKPEILLLDEPTNHLDLESIEWLENYIRHYPHAVILVCHDRTFIDHVADEIVEIEFGKTNRYVGNYGQYLEQKEKFLEKNHEAYVRQQQEIARIEQLINRFKGKPTKVSMVRSRQKMLDKMDRIEDLKADNKQIKISFSSYRPSGKNVLSVENLATGYDDVLSVSSFDLQRGDRLAIVGPNGTGKSTLMKTLAGRLEKINGKFEFGHHVDMGYFDQEITRQSGENNVLDELWNENPEADQKEIRNVLAAFLFRGEDVFKSLSTLSGGEKVRLALAKLMMDHDNLLLLDEPTNHLDIPSKEALEKALQDYDGTLLFVSHDRWFLDKMSTGILQVDNQSRYFRNTTYREYLEKKDQPVDEKKTVRKPSVKNDNQMRKSYQNRIKNLEKLLDQLHEDLEKLEDLRYEEEYYLDYSKMDALEEDIEKIRKDIEEFSSEWEEKSLWLEENAL